ncbi:MAG: 50S ribosomal protein L3 [Pseudomonadota bacterium]|nr:50S ribosomal protein L3 [Pseudomonadota bacterium]
MAEQADQEATAAASEATANAGDAAGTGSDTSNEWFQAIQTGCGFIGKKVGMTRMPDGDFLAAVTLIKLEPQKITAVRTQAKNGYNAIQIGYYPKRPVRLTKPIIGQLRKAGLEDNFARFKEFRIAQPVDDQCIGKDLTISMVEDALADVKLLDVQGITKGRGFQGAIKRWGSKTGRSTHGSRFHRRPGSLGQRAAPGRVFKNRKQPGQMGGVKRTVQNMRVLAIDKELNVIAVCGSVPANKGSYLVISPAVKHRKLTG